MNGRTKVTPRGSGARQIVLFDGVTAQVEEGFVVLHDAAQETTERVPLVGAGVRLLIPAAEGRQPRTVHVDGATARGLVGSARACVEGGRVRRRLIRRAEFAPLLATTTAALFAAHARALGLATLVFAAATLLLGADSPTVVAATSAPALVLASTALHEAGHWWMLRRLASPAAGALLIDGWSVRLVRPALRGRRLAVVAAAGPVAAGAAALVPTLAAATTCPQFTIVFGVLVVANLLGLTPWTHDGRDLADGLTPDGREPAEAG